MSALRIAAASLASIRRHAEASRPEECCGILLGETGPTGARIAEVLPAANVAAGDRRAGYSIEPRKLLAAAKRARALGLEIVGYYHSHSRGPARPSPRDREHAWPEVSYLILGFDEDDRARSWRLGSGGEFEEERLEIEGDR